VRTPLEKKSTIKEIEKRFNNDVERFSNLETGQQAIIDARLMMDLLAHAAAKTTPHAKRLLDIGCGAGNNTIKIVRILNGLDCDLVDLSLPMLERARERISKEESGRIRLLQGDVRELELGTDRYDIVLAAAVLHHLRDEADWIFVFKKVYDAISFNGSFWISDMVFHDTPAIQELMWERYREHLESLGGKDYRKRVFDYIDKEDSPRSLTYQLALMEKVGFEKIEVLHKSSCFAAFGGVKTRSSYTNTKRRR
jgi:tRNA (cmo5U34)-methyltransferase